MRGVHTAATDEAMWLDLLQQAAPSEEVEKGRRYVSLTTRVSAIDPLALFGESTWENRFYWADPLRRFEVGAIGTVRLITAAGAERFAQVRKELQELEITHRAAQEPDDARIAGPLLYGGFSFAPGDAAQPSVGADKVLPWRAFPDALFTLPQFTLVRSGGGTWLTQTASLDGKTSLSEVAHRLGAERTRLLSRLVSAASEAPRPLASTVASSSSNFKVAWSETAFSQHEHDLAAWSGSVEQLAQAARAGTVDKTVLARHVRIPMPSPCDLSGLINRLEQEHKESYIFAVVRGGDAFVGATPERLIDVDGESVRTVALAGSTRRGAHPGEDERLATELLNSAKDRREHEIVRRWLNERLGPWCVTIDADETPDVLRFPTVQHLCTPVEGVLKRRTHIVDLVEALHPTPAVGGYPLNKALALIARHEPVSRGWYAGPIGWLTPQGSGEMAVGIRSALITPEEAVLYAGCGIVDGSAPDRELEESRIKLNVILDSLVRGVR